MTVVSLEGSPYELGYARGILLKDEIRNEVRDKLYRIRMNPAGTSIGEKKMMSRTTELLEFIPEEYRDEIKGLSAGSGIDYHTLIMYNITYTLRGCTSIAVIGSDGEILRSRNLDWRPEEVTLPFMVFIYKPQKGYAFASISTAGKIGITTAMNEKGLNFGNHYIWRHSGWKGIPASMLRRKIVQYSGSINDAYEILKKAHRGLPEMYLVADQKNASKLEFNHNEVVEIKMDGDYLIITNHTQQLKEGKRGKHSEARYRAAESCLKNKTKGININELITINRNSSLSQIDDLSIENLLSVIFHPVTLDFWVTTDSYPATRGRWAGFNLNYELHETGKEPSLLIIPSDDK
jgi:predicted choloylglycine hydrolase